jgi:hypothetical protein
VTIEPKNKDPKRAALVLLDGVRFIFENSLKLSLELN